jgi:uncharacterized protein (UPF0254 family)
VFSNDQQTQLGVVVVDGVTDGAGADVDVGVTDGAGADVDVGVDVGKQTDIHNSNVENVPPGTNEVHGQL